MSVSLRENWRIIVLLLLIAGSGLAIFGVVHGDDPAATPTREANTLSTDLRYGLDLAGGARIRAPLYGYTATGVAVSTDTHTLERQIAANLTQADPSDVSVKRRQPKPNGEARNAIEVTAPNVSKADFQAALNASDISYDTVRSGVTKETRTQTVNVLSSKLSESGLSSGSVRQVQSASGQHFILIEVADTSKEEVIDLVEDRGKVQIDIYYPTDNGTYATRPAVLEREDFSQIGAASEDERTGPHVPVTLSESSAQRFQDAVVDTGVAKQGGSRCRYQSAPNTTGPCLLTKVDGKVVYSAGMSPSLADSMRAGTWERNPSFILQTENLSEARTLAVNLHAGALPAKLNLDAGTSTYISPTQGQHFKSSSLIIGLLAVFGVSFAVFFRYRDVRIAVPMLFAALSEVVILLGVAALLKYPIDLSVVAGFIAVIGTGVDDLIIIANEVRAESGVSSNHVFQKRFKKAFWVIGAAAITTIVAMSPLVVLSLGDLRGFAIFTIIGVLIGVTITRPAYGDILRHLLMDN